MTTIPQYPISTDGTDLLYNAGAGETTFPVGGGVGAGFDWRNPYDMTTMSSAIIKEGTASHTVTTGKVLLIQRANGQTTSTLNINPSGDNFRLVYGEIVLSSPIIVPAGDVIELSATGGAWSGVEVTANANITPVIEKIANGITYTVPTGKIFVMTNLYCQVTTYVLDLGTDYSRWWSGATCNHDNNGYSNDFGTPSFLPAGTVISITGTGADWFTIMGYTIPDDFDF